MAQIVSRPRADGGTSYQVKWRQDGAWQTENFANSGPKAAESFRLAVEAAGGRWPDGWVKGEGWGSAAPAPPSPEPVTTLSDVWASYLKHQRRRVRLGQIDSYSVHRYQGTWSGHIEEHLGHVPFADLGDEHLTEWVDTLVDEGWSPKSIKNWHGVLHATCEHGRKTMRHLRHDNPAAGLELPRDDKHAKRQVRFFQQDEWALLRACLRSDVLLMVDTLLASAMRWGECAALRVGDVSRAEGGMAVLHIERTWATRDPASTAPIRTDLGENAKHVLRPPKGRKERWVVVPADVAAGLLEACAGRDPGEYVFVTRAGGPWRYTEFHGDRWAPARAEALRRGMAKASVTPHMLRHTAVVWSLAEGVPIEKVSERLGHSTIKTTWDIYGGLLNVSDPSMANAMARQMLAVRETVTLAPSRDEVEARRVRPGRRGERRERAR